MASCTMRSTCLPAIASSGRSIWADVRVRRLAHRHALLQGLELVLLAGVPHAQVLGPVFAEVDRDSVDPRRELRLPAERADRLEDLDEDLLREVLRLGPVAEHPQDEREDAPLVGPHERVERSLVARHEPLDEPRLVLARLAGRHRDRRAAARRPIVPDPSRRAQRDPRARRPSRVAPSPVETPGRAGSSASRASPGCVCVTDT